MHAEIPQDDGGNLEYKDGADDSRSYDVYLKSRPASW